MHLRSIPLAARVALLGLGLSAPAALPAASDLVTTAVYSWADEGYRREMQPNGRPAREYYAISNGGAMPGTVRDRAIEAVPFPDVAGKLAQHLGRQNYFLAPDSRAASLLLVVHWGTTAPFTDSNERFMMDRASSLIGQMNVSHPPGRFGGIFGLDGMPAVQRGIGPESSTPSESGTEYMRGEVEGSLQELKMFQEMRQQALLPTAQLLGYVSAVDEANDTLRYLHASNFNELIGEVSDPRYYIIVSAYDFRRAVEHNDRKLLWQTRISITSRGVRFSDHFGDMLASGVRYYGKDSRGQLVRRHLRDVRVDIGEATVVRIEHGDR